MFHRRPIGLNSLASNAGRSLARLNALEGFARAVLVGVVPLLALDALGSKEAVARMYLLAAIFTLCITLNFSSLERLLQRRWVVTLAGGFLCLAAALLYWGHGLVFALGIGLRASAASLFSVCLSLYIMDYITKQHLALNESRRMLYTGAAWLTGPFLGTWLWNQGWHTHPFILSVTSALLMVTFFWWLRLGHNQILSAARSRSLSPFKAVPRYFSQKRLRIAYSITLTRATFWVTLFIYGPIYVVEAGLPGWLAGAFLSLVSGFLFLSPLVRRASERFGTRTVIMAALTLAGSSMFMLGVLGQPRPAGLVFWCTAALGCACLDVLGNIPFMRMVKPYERTDMTMVFSTWREMSELLTPLTITLVTLVLPFRTYYLLLGAALVGVALLAARLPRRL
ncbi:MAG: hypothetical protein KDI15_10685 [Thiothrix sp.]|nr:hypothetical protein [Thiothrix sp.]HPE60565.1 hypothetical protein [Thiolinea sp.]